MINDFVAIDFEFATSIKGSICSVGIATFHGGQVVDEYYTLVRPPNNEYSPYTIGTHGIKPQDTKDSRSFGEVYQEIKDRIFGKILVAHGAFNTDKHCLEQAMALENIYDDLKLDWKCTYTIVNASLDIACRECGISLKHHHALSDAIACGLLYQEYLNGSIDFARIDTARLNQGPKEKNVGVYPAKISSDILKPDFENVTDTNNPFFKKKVVVSGFDDLLKEKLAKELKDLGADVDSGIGKHTNYLIIGDSPGPSKLEKMKTNIKEGKEAKIITYNEYLVLLRS
jgi:DNA polymerase-3 subunit epsilon